MSISEVVQGLSAANMKAGEVQASLQNGVDNFKAAVDGLSECVVLESAVLGEMANGTISDALGLLMDAQNRVQAHIQALELVVNYVAVVMEKNDDMISRLSV